MEYFKSISKTTKHFNYFALKRLFETNCLGRGFNSDEADGGRGLAWLLDR